MRHRWGEIFRCNLDWDQETSYSLKRLFEQRPRPKPSQNKVEIEISVPEFGMIGIVSFPDNNDVVPPTFAQRTSVPEELRVSYRTENGEVKYLTYLISPFNEDDSLSD